MPKRLHGGSSPKKQQAYQSHLELFRTRHLIQVKKKLEKKLKELTKLHPTNEYKIRTVKDKKGYEIQQIKLIAGKRYKKSKEQRMKERQEREASKK